MTRALEEVNMTALNTVSAPTIQIIHIYQIGFLFMSLAINPLKVHLAPSLDERVNRLLKAKLIA